MTKMQAARTSRKGQTFVEYALVLALLTVVVFVAVTELGFRTQGAMQGVADELAACQGSGLPTSGVPMDYVPD